MLCEIPPDIVNIGVTRSVYTIPADHVVIFGVCLLNVYYRLLRARANGLTQLRGNQVVVLVGARRVTHAILPLLAKHRHPHDNYTKASGGRLYKLLLIRRIFTGGSCDPRSHASEHKGHSLLGIRMNGYQNPPPPRQVQMGQTTEISVNARKCFVVGSQCATFMGGGGYAPLKPPHVCADQHLCQVDPGGQLQVLSSGCVMRHCTLTFDLLYGCT